MLIFGHRFWFVLLWNSIASSFFFFPFYSMTKRRTCTEEPYTHLNQHRGESATPRAATFSCNECSHQELSICIQISGGQAILILYKPHNCTAPDPYRRLYHVDQWFDNHLYIYEQELPLPRITLDISSYLSTFLFSPYWPVTLNRSKNE